jgi:tRNA (adenine37-N6)-methyltransferase
MRRTVTTFTVRPIGFVRSPFVEKVEAPRQAVADGAEGVEGRIELLAEHEHALSDLEGFERIWILFWFHEAADASAPSKRSKVLPPRSDQKRGVFATRSPHRPNPIGMSAVRLVRVEGTTVHVRDLDLLDGTPVIDIKPYLSYADAFPDAKAGWLEPARDPRPSWDVRVLQDAEAQLAWIAAHGGGDLKERVVETLALGPQPHPYRRIKKKEDGTYVLAVKDWRVRFVIDGRVVTVQRIATGYRDKELATAAPGTPEELHRAFVATFG